MKLREAYVVGNTRQIHWIFECERCSTQVEVVAESGPNQSAEAIKIAANEHGACR